MKRFVTNLPSNFIYIIDTSNHKILDWITGILISLITFNSNDFVVQTSVAG